MRKILVLILLISFTVGAQVRDKGIFKERKKGFFETIKKETNKFRKEKKEKRKYFKLDFSNWDLPQSKDEFKYQWHNEPISQGWTGTCWSFSTTSYFESEIYRMHNIKVKLSEIWTAYWEYTEKAREYIKTRGKSVFGEGSEANAVNRIYKKYGIVPEEVYNGMLPGQKFHDHRAMYDEMYDFLKGCKKNSIWNEEFAVETVKAIMDKYIGTPPAKFTYQGKEYTPKSFMKDYLKFNPDDYVDILSYMQKPYWKQVEYQVPDNWWHSEDYYNVPLDYFMEILKKALRNGSTLVIGGDVSEAGLDSEHEVAVVPSFDIPSEYIDENARQFRFSNKTTTDDHGVHIVGFTEKDGKDWYLIKDSGAGSRDGKNKGYYFFHEDYVKLKIMDFMVHKDFLDKDFFEKFNK